MPVAVAVTAAWLWLGGAILSPAAAVLPTGGQVVAGSGAISFSGTETTVRQDTDRMATQWQTFSIGEGHTVRFVQPSAAAVALNRVTGSEASLIQGQLVANGQVFLLNPNGVLFTSTAQVSVGGLIASTLNMSDEDFMSGRLRLDGESLRTVTNQGSLSAAEGGFVALVAATVVNDGQISAPGGDVLLGAGQTVTLDLGGPVKLQVDRGALQAQIHNGGAIDAGGGRILLSAKAASEIGSAVINQSGFIEASTLAVGERGDIVLSAEGGAVIQAGTLRADGVDGGRIAIQARAVIDAGTAQARGTETGGSIEIQASHVEQTAAASLDAGGSAAGGTVQVIASGMGWFSGRMAADSAQGGGGDVSVTAAKLTIAGATLSADGAAGGGRVRVGGGWQGADAELPNALRTTVSASSQFSASATVSGDGGTVVVWSEEGTGAAGSISARGQAGGNGGYVEVSSRGLMAFGAEVDVTAPAGAAGRLLLNANSLSVEDDALPNFTVTPLVDSVRAMRDNGNYGSFSVAELASGNFIVGSWLDSTVANEAGAVRLYAPDGRLISTLVGTTPGDRIGSPIGNESGVLTLTNGNYVVKSPFWDNASAIDAGGVTWGSGTLGISGAVSQRNSLVGTNSNDWVGQQGITALSNGNYVVSSQFWNSPSGVLDVGAATWGDGANGTRGVVSAANSLVGSRQNDFVGRVTALTNGNYVVSSPSWSSATATDVGAVTWGDGTTGVKGAVTSINSLVGTRANDQVGWGIRALDNGNYVVASIYWDSTTGVGDVGAVTWGDGTVGIRGAVTSSNSLVGSRFRDRVGEGGIVALTNGNYVVSSPVWNSLVGPLTILSIGAVTWGDGTKGISGVVSGANSLVGSRQYDGVGGGGITALANGNYVVLSPSWDSATVSDVGAVTWGDGTTGVRGLVSESNSLVGSRPDDLFGSSVRGLANSNYVVVSPSWDSATVSDVGAVTWGDGTTGIRGVVSESISLVGARSNDQVGRGGVTALSNGNYVVVSPLWDGAAHADVGAVTWGNGMTGIRGPVNESNSLVGTSPGDQEFTAVRALTNGNYVVSSPSWDSATSTNAGAVTWADGTTGIQGIISESNSLVGTSPIDQVGGQLAALSNGNYVVASYLWDSPTASNAGAVTWGDGATGIRGVVNETNSLVGTRSDDEVGRVLQAFPSGFYGLKNVPWNSYLGAATFADGSAGIRGEVSAANSLVGTSIGEYFDVQFAGLSDGRVLVFSPFSNQMAGRVVLVEIGGARSSGVLPDVIPSGGDSSLPATQLQRLLDSGAHVVLQANNDITVNHAITVANPSGAGGNLTLQAGRSVLLNADITTGGGNLTLVANEQAASGAVAAHRDPGAASITMAEGTRIEAGAGHVELFMRDDARDTDQQAGAITLAGVAAASLRIDSVALAAGFSDTTKVFDGLAAAAPASFSYEGIAFTADSNLSLVQPPAVFTGTEVGEHAVVATTPLRIVGFAPDATADLLRAGEVVQVTGKGLITEPERTQPQPLDTTAAPILPEPVTASVTVVAAQPQPAAAPDRLAQSIRSPGERLRLGVQVIGCGIGLPADASGLACQSQIQE